jgi:hypothetical protein
MGHMDTGDRDALIGLVGCGKSKQAHAAPARDLYTGALFRKSLAYAEARCSVVYVLSAKHGLLALDQVVEPYEFSLAELDAAGRERWAVGIWDAIIARGHVDISALLVLAGDLYFGPLFDAAVAQGLLVELLDPLRGKQIGERLQFLAPGPRAAAPNHEVDDIQAAAILRELGECA